MKVDFLHHTAGDQEFVGGLVGLEHLFGQFGRERILHQQPGIPAHLHIQPLVDQNAGDHVGQQHVTAGQFLPLFQVLHTQAQIVEFGGRLFQDPHGQPRGQNLVVDDAFGQQLEPARRSSTSTRLAETGQQRALQGLFRLVEPGRLALLERHPGIPPVLHFLGRSSLIQDGRQARFTSLDQLGQRPSDVNDKEFTRLLGQRGNMLVG